MKGLHIGTDGLPGDVLVARRYREAAWKYFEFDREHGEVLVAFNSVLETANIVPER